MLVRLVMFRVHFKLTRHLASKLIGSTADMVAALLPKKRLKFSV